MGEFAIGRQAERRPQHSTPSPGTLRVPLPDHVRDRLSPASGEGSPAAPFTPDFSFRIFGKVQAVPM
jgi:hypothetical protein